MRRDTLVLRIAAHKRHAVVSTLCWWWCPPIHAVSQIVHAQVVKTFYDSLDAALDQEDKDDT